VFGDENVPYLYNHYRFVVQYHRPEDQPDVYRIVGLEVEPQRSVVVWFVVDLLMLY
jgi:hypothetical protein